MLTSVESGRCAECSGEILDAGEELVCKCCGVVTAKLVIETGPGKAIQAIDFTAQALGGYLGPIDYGFGEKFSKGFSASSSSFRYLKLISDNAGREDSTVYSCVKMIERVCEKLTLPRIIMAQAVVVAKKAFEIKRKRSDITTAAVSAYAIITACKIEGVTSVGVKEIVEAHRVLGRRVKISALIQLSLNSPSGLGARRPEDYVGRVLGKLSGNEALGRELREEGVNVTAYLNRLREAAKEALAALGQDGRGGHSPCALAATAVYAGEVALARRESRRRVLTQKDVAESVDVAEYTVREQFGELFRPVMPQLAAEVRVTPSQPLTGSS